MLRKLNRIAQSTAEYAIIIAIVVGAVIAMQVYVKRGLQARVKGAVDFKGSASDTDYAASRTLFTSTNYEPYYSASDMNVESDAKRREEMTKGGGVAKEVYNEATNRTGLQRTKNQDEQD